MTKTYLPVKLKILLATVSIFLVGFTASAQENQPWSVNNSPLPAATGFVNDYAGVIDPPVKEQLEAKLKNLKETTNPSVEIAVAIVRTTGERAIFDYSLATARGWKIGSKEDDNPSALLMVAIDDRKYFTQVSKDLEDELPDGVVGNLQRQYLVPEFRQGNYGKGISDTIDAYIQTIESKRSGTDAPPAANTDSGRPIGTTRGFSGGFCCLIGVGLLLLIIFSNRGGGKSGRDNDRWGGGGFGGGGSALPWVIGSILASGSGGGSSSSGSWGGSSGGSDWGGFGGGGDFGGGGAGGDW